MNEQRGRFMSDGNYDGIRSMYTEDAMYFADKMVPGMGLEGRINVSIFTYCIKQFISHCFNELIYT